MLPQWLSDGDTVLDAGANLGFYTFRMAKLVGRPGKVVACEPQESLARRLKFSSNFLRLPQVVIAPVALAAKSDELPFVIPRTFSGGIDDGQAHVVLPGENGDLRVPAVTLDELWNSLGLKRLHFAKIDVEGTELDVIRGGMNTIKGNRPLIICESQSIHASRYGNSVQDVFDLLGHLGYAAHGLRNGTMIALPHPDDDFINYIFIP